MKKGKFTEIMEEMDRLEKVEISDELVDTLKDYFKDEIAKEKTQRNENEKAARQAGYDEQNRGEENNGQQDWI